jgi:hypothetical protein
MIAIFQSVLGLLVGLALAVYGIAHTVTHYPGPKAFAELAGSMPSLGAVLFFFLGILASVVGVLLLFSSVRRLRRRWRHVRQVTDRQRPYAEEMDGDEPAWAAGYR